MTPKPPVVEDPDDDDEPEDPMEPEDPEEPEAPEAPEEPMNGDAPRPKPYPETPPTDSNQSPPFNPEASTVGMAAAYNGSQGVRAPATGHQRTHMPHVVTDHMQRMTHAHDKYSGYTSKQCINQTNIGMHPIGQRIVDLYARKMYGDPLDHHA